MLLLYYGLIKTDATMIISINAVGCVIEVTYLVLFVFYASKQEKVGLCLFRRRFPPVFRIFFLMYGLLFLSQMATLKLVLLFIVGFILILSMTMFLLKERQRVNIVGWICAAFSIAVFASPLSIMVSEFQMKCYMNFNGRLLKCMFVDVRG